MRIISFDAEAFDQYNSWAGDKKVYARLQRLISDAARNPFDGIGKPEPLKGELRGMWSRGLTDEDRLVYQVTETGLYIVACRYHYR
ncbi:MAG: Txe/YoeB family addiction module toxin [Blastocatellia bacterium]|nr:Txe/YoeB family addiction module toxin [Blastocatellia bacterium]